MGKKINVLSLFDGIGCGQIALERAGINVDTYFASEVDRHAIMVTQHNYPNTIQLGDVTDVNAQDLPEINLLIGGSPCQGFSFAGKQLNFEDPRSKLFFEYVRILNEIRLVNPDVKFLLENVRMKKEYLDVISDYLGVEPIMINSSSVSAQNRIRYYWTNIPNITHPEDNNIVLSDILELPPGDGYDESSLNVKVDLPEGWEKYVPDDLPDFCDPYNKSEIKGLKSNTLRTNPNNGNMWVKFNNRYRNLTRTECERLQTVPDGYTSAISSPKAKKCLGNGWTVNVIAHIFKALD
jgi:site-specific DNA-cytosine methylase